MFLHETLCHLFRLLHPFGVFTRFVNYKAVSFLFLITRYNSFKNPWKFIGIKKPAVITKHYNLKLAA
jgi:hypothetical protein